MKIKFGLRTTLIGLAAHFGLIVSSGHAETRRATPENVHEFIGVAVFITIRCPEWTLDEAFVQAYLRTNGVTNFDPQHPRIINVARGLKDEPPERICGVLAPEWGETGVIVRK